MKIRKLKARIKKKCPCWEKGHWFIEGYDTCNGTREREPCKCGGDRSKCDFYSGATHAKQINTEIVAEIEKRYKGAKVK